MHKPITRPSYTRLKKHYGSHEIDWFDDIATFLANKGYPMCNTCYLQHKIFPNDLVMNELLQLRRQSSLEWSWNLFVLPFKTHQAQIGLSVHLGNVPLMYIFRLGLGYLFTAHRSARAADPSVSQPETSSDEGAGAAGSNSVLAHSFPGIIAVADVTRDGLLGIGWRAPSRVAHRQHHRRQQRRKQGKGRAEHHLKLVMWNESALYWLARPPVSVCVCVLFELLLRKTCQRHLLLFFVSTVLSFC